MDDAFERTVDAVGRVAKVVLVPWGGAAACVDAYEAAIRADDAFSLNARARGSPSSQARSVLALVRGSDPRHRRHAPLERALDPGRVTPRPPGIVNGLDGRNTVCTGRARRTMPVDPRRC